ncbi:MAG: bleomycin resistance protein [Fimbriimonas sp.]
MATVPELKVVSPVLVVSDVAASIEFFQSKLGFGKMFAFGAPVEYGAMERGEVQIHLTRDYSRGRVGKGSCYVSLYGVDALHEELQAKEVPITEAIGDRPYGMRDFYVEDLDGNTIGFGEPLGAY